MSEGVGTGIDRASADVLAISHATCPFFRFGRGNREGRALMQPRRRPTYSKAYYEMGNSAMRVSHRPMLQLLPHRTILLAFHLA